MALAAKGVRKLPMSKDTTWMLKGAVSRARFPA